jgi:hypothetical protein
MLNLRAPTLAQASRQKLVWIASLSTTPNLQLLKLYILPSGCNVVLLFYITEQYPDLRILGLTGSIFYDFIFEIYELMWFLFFVEKLRSIKFGTMPPHVLDWLRQHLWLVHLDAEELDWDYNEENDDPPLVPDLEFMLFSLQLIDLVVSLVQERANKAVATMRLSLRPQSDWTTMHRTRSYSLSQRDSLSFSSVRDRFRQGS